MFCFSMHDFTRESVINRFTLLIELFCDVLCTILCCDSSVIQ